VAELIGTFWLTLGGCGTAVIAASFPQVGVGLLGVSFAFGLTVLTMAYAIGHISGCHLNPAVTVGLTAGRRFPSNLIVPYIVAQVAGAVLAAAILYLIASGAPDFDAAKGFAANGYGEHSPGQYSLLSALVTEVVLTTFGKTSAVSQLHLNKRTSRSTQRTCPLRANSDRMRRSKTASFIRSPRRNPPPLHPKPTTSRQNAVRR
jgi:glycerol uptake facilitator-like aquaporin